MSDLGGSPVRFEMLGPLPAWRGDVGINLQRAEDFSLRADANGPGTMLVAAAGSHLAGGTDG